jgi:glyoxylase-like metal-dependent hydrolase (beta-lactamase superfamily II)
VEKRIIECLAVGDIATNCWIYSLPTELPAEQPASCPCAVVDPGGDAPYIISFLRQLKLYPRYILLTHGHFDHLIALPDLAKTFTPAPLVAIHRDDAAYLGKGALEAHRASFAAIGEAAYVDSHWKPMPAAGQLLAGGGRIGPFAVIHTPGHTPGSVCYYDESAGVLFSGDTLFRGSYGRTDLPGGDRSHLARSLKLLFAINGDITVCPGHGPGTTLEEERRRFDIP